MRQLLLLLIMLGGMDAYGQLNIPLHKGLRPINNLKGELPNVRMQYLMDSAEKRLRNDAALKMRREHLQSSDTSSDQPQPFSMLTKKEQDMIDEQIGPELNKYKEEATYRTVAILNEQTSRIQPLITGGINNIFQGSYGATGNLSLGLQYRITSFRPDFKTNNNDAKKNKYRIDPHFIYTAWSTATAKSADSANIFKSIIFPELAQSDFIVGWHHDIIEGNFVRGWMAEASFTSYKDTAGKVLFRSENLTGGYWVSFTGNLPSLNVPAGFKALLYFNVVNIDPKYNDGLNKATDTAAMHNTFFNAGIRIQAEVNGASLFFNGKYILNPQHNVVNPDFVRFVYTVGTLVSL